jgi:hypothetical protein
MRNAIAALIMLAGLGLLIWIHNAGGFSDSCDENLSFLERGTYMDCEARNPKPKTSPGLVAAAASHPTYK